MKTILAIAVLMLSAGPTIAQNDGTVPPSPSCPAPCMPHQPDYPNLPRVPVVWPEKHQECETTCTTNLDGTQTCHTTCRMVY